MWWMTGTGLLILAAIGLGGKDHRLAWGPALTCRAAAGLCREMRGGGYAGVLLAVLTDAAIGYDCTGAGTGWNSVMLSTRVPCWVMSQRLRGRRRQVLLHGTGPF